MPVCACGVTCSYRKAKQCAKCFAQRGRHDKIRLCVICKERPVSTSSRHGSCSRCYRDRRAEVDALIEIRTDAPPVEDAIRKLLKAAPKRLDELAQVIEKTPGQTLDLLVAMRKAGVNLHDLGGRWSLDREPETGQTSAVVLKSDRDGWHTLGALGDTHLCSKQERLEELRDIYRIYEANGVQTVLHTGNYIDGEARFNKYELKVHGMDAQLQYLADQYPHVAGLKTFMISGDDHEGWYGQREGVDIGRYMQNVAHAAGRTDILNLGYMECFIPIEHAVTRKRTMLHVIHPGGGSAYATSYTVQKICEAYEGGEKPAVTLVGHYHKAEHLEIRNIHAFQTGCFQDQTIFARKKKLTFTIGGWLLKFRQNPDTGAVEEVVSYFKNYFNRGYYTQNRWSLSGPVSLVPRLSV
jgi:hypothetical protein